MKVIRVHHLSNKDRLVLRELWNDSYPQQLIFHSLEAFDTYFASLEEVVHLCCYDGPLLVGWAFTFRREESKWFALIVHTNYRLRGVGSLLLNELKQKETSLYGWVVDHDRYRTQSGAPYISPLAFYRKHHFTVRYTVRLETLVLSAVQILWSNKSRPLNV